MVGKVSHGMVYGMVWYGMVWYGMVRHGMDQTHSRGGHLYSRPCLSLTHDSTLVGLLPSLHQQPMFTSVFERVAYRYIYQGGFAAAG